LIDKEGKVVPSKDLTSLLENPPPPYFRPSTGSSVYSTALYYYMHCTAECGPLSV
jgi:hypothetical protein